MSGYAHPEVLVDTAWLTAHGGDLGHIPGALSWNWQHQLCDTVRRDILAQGDFEELLSVAGVNRDTTIILYGDSNNWFAAWAFWQLKIYGHADVRLLNGGRKKWLADGGSLTQDVPSFPRTKYQADPADLSLRAFLPAVQKAFDAGSTTLIDVRSPQEFSGEILAPPGLPETCQRGGHIPGARNVPWGKACADDGTFRSADELQSLYGTEGIRQSEPAITYCRIGERSSHTWFVLKYLLGVKDVKNYDGSWTEWGNLVGAPVERGAAKTLEVGA